MRVFVIGLTGRVGSLLTQELLGAGDDVRGLVRRSGQRDALAAQGVAAVVGDLTTLDAHELAAAFGDADVVLYCAGTDGDDRDAIDALDHDAVLTTLRSVSIAGVGRFIHLSVIPEGWRERALPDVLEHYFATKKRVDVVVSRSDVDWLILRPAELTNEPGTGRVALGPAEIHEHIPRTDVAATLAALVHRPAIRRRILELNRGDTQIEIAVQAVDG